MKKLLCILTTIVLCASLLSGCGAVGEAEEAISLIGTVSLESLEAIENAEALYSQLSEADRAKVENHATLADAREKYDQLALEDHLLKQADAAIAAVKEVTEGGTLAWEDFIRYEEMLAALSALKEADLYYKLTDSQCSDVELATDAAVACCCDRVLVLYDNLQPQEALDMLLDLLERYPDREDVSALVPEVFAHCETLADENEYKNPQFVVDMVTGLAEAFPEQELSELMLDSCEWSYFNLVSEEQDKGNYDEAIALLQQALPYSGSLGGYRLSSAYIAKYDAELAETGDKLAVLNQLDQVPGEVAVEYSFRQYVDNLLDELYKEQGKTRPAHSAVIGNNPHDGKFNLLLKSGLQDVCYKITSASDPSKYTLFFVHGGGYSSKHLRLAEGSYTVTCAVGWLWDGKDALFGEDTVFYEFVDMPCDIVVHGTSAGAAPGYTMTRYTMSCEEYSPVLDTGEPNPALKEISREEF